MTIGFLKKSVNEVLDIYNGRFRNRALWLDKSVYYCFHLKLDSSTVRDFATLNHFVLSQSDVILFPWDMSSLHSMKFLTHVYLFSDKSPR